MTATAQRSRPTIAGTPTRIAVPHSTFPSAPWASVADDRREDDRRERGRGGHPRRRRRAGRSAAAPSRRRRRRRRAPRRSRRRGRSTTRGRTPAGAAGAVLGSPVVTVSDPASRATPSGRSARAWPTTAVFCDFDGTLAPIVPRPEDARLLEGVREALRWSWSRPPRLVAFVSGRGLADLESRRGHRRVRLRRQPRHGDPPRRPTRRSWRTASPSTSPRSPRSPTTLAAPTRLGGRGPADGGQGRDPERPRPRRPRSRGRPAAARPDRLGGPRPRPGARPRAARCWRCARRCRWTRARRCGRCWGHRRARGALHRRRPHGRRRVGSPARDAHRRGSSTRRSAWRWPAARSPAAVREAADVEVAGPPGALEVLRALAHA